MFTIGAHGWHLAYGREAADLPVTSVLFIIDPVVTGAVSKVTSAHQVRRN